MLKNSFIHIIILLVFTSKLYALEIQAIESTPCNIDTGIIIDAHEEAIELLKLDGTSVSISSQDITKMVSFATNENPFREVHIPRQSYLKKYILHDDDNSIIGWAYKFVQDMIFLYDISGNQHVISKNDIASIEDFTRLNNSAITTPTHTPIRIDLKNFFDHCQLAEVDTTNSLKAHSVLADELKISTYLEDFILGYQAIAGLEQRIQFYAKPYLYPKEFRMALGNPGFYFQWSTGKQYHAQTLNRIGQVVSAITPELFNDKFSYESTFKTHFFHGYFLGNIKALAAGTNTIEDENFEDTYTVDTQTDYNYIVMMGVDYKNYSISFGQGFLANSYFLDSEMRYIAATKAQSLVNFKFIKDNYKLDITYGLPNKFTQPLEDIYGYSFFTFDDNYTGACDTANSRLDKILPDKTCVQSNPNSQYESRRDEIGATSYYNGYQAHSISEDPTHSLEYLRINFAYTINDTTNIGIQTIFKQASYTEKMQLYSPSDNSIIATTKVTNSLKANSVDTMLYYSNDFSDYVGGKLYYSISKTTNKLTLLDQSIATPAITDNTFGGILEFIF